MPQHVARPSIRLPVTFMYRDHTGWNTSTSTSKIISRLNGLIKVPAWTDLAMGDLVQREHPQNRVE